MIQFFLSEGNIPFVVALVVMVVFTVIEVISASMGVGLSEMVDSLLPEFDADIDIDVDAEIEAGSVGDPGNSLVKLLAWFRVGEVPVIMLFIIFLTGFGLSGIIIQFITVSTIGIYVPTLIASIIAVLAALPTVRYCGGMLGKYMPKDETYVVSEESFIGMVASITLGTAEAGKAAQAKLRDKHGQTHYVLVEPDNPHESFEQGEQAIIVSRNGSIYKVITASGSRMVEEG